MVFLDPARRPRSWRVFGAVLALVLATELGQTAYTQGVNPPPPLSQPGIVRQKQPQGVTAVDRPWTTPTTPAPAVRPARAAIVVGS